MEITILGSIGLAHDGVPVAMPRLKVRGAFAFLLLNHNKVVAADSIARALWDEEEATPRERRSALQTYISLLRHFLNEEGCGDLLTEPAGYQLIIDAALVDYHRFKILANSGHAAFAQGRLAVAAEKLTAALDLWRGRPMPGLKTAWAERMREAMITQDLLPAVHALCDVKLAEDDGQFVLDSLRQLATSYPGRESERSIDLWMRALAATDRVGEIDMVFAGYARRLRQDAGVEPSGRLKALRDKLTAAAPAPVRSGVDGWWRSVRRTDPSLQLLRDNPYYLGRDELLAQLDELVENAGRRNVIVRIDGGPGVGKTAFVTRWAWRRADWFPDGMLYVDLGGYAIDEPLAPRDVLVMFLHALGIEEIPPTERERVGVLRHALADRRMLVILDNARWSDHVRPILGAVSCCTVLVTSRQQLRHLAYEGSVHGITMPQLDVEHAVELLTRRLGERALAEPEAVRYLASRCDCVPLALIIVGEHVVSRPAVSLRTHADELARRLLDVGGHGDGEHVLTLRVAFSWSIDALPAATARLFRLLGLHPGSRFSTELAVALGGDARETTETSLDLLMGANLLQQDQTQRYLLHDTLHDYAADSVRRTESASDRAAAIRRMLDWYVETARTANDMVNSGPGSVPTLPEPSAVRPSTFDSEVAALGWLAGERANLVSLVRFAATQGLHHHAWRIAACLDVVLSRFGDRRDRVQVNELGYQSVVVTGERTGKAGLLNNAGGAALALHDYDVAERRYEAALVIFVDEGDEPGHKVALHNLGRVCLGRRRFRQAIRYFERSLRTFGPGLFDRADANNWRLLGDVYRELGRFREALTNYHLALSTVAKIGDSPGAELIALARLHLEQGELTDAIKVCAHSLDLHRERMDRVREAEALGTLAEAYLRQHNDAAVAAAAQAAAYHHELYDLRGEGRDRATLGRAYVALGEPALAEEHLRAAHALLTSVGDDQGAEEVARVLAGVVDQPADIPGQRQLTIMEPSVRPARDDPLGSWSGRRHP